MSEGLARHRDPRRWEREHRASFTLLSMHIVAADAAPRDYPHGRVLGRGVTSDPAYWSAGVVRPDDHHWVFQYTLRGEGLLEEPSGVRPVRPGQGFLVRVDDPDRAYGYPPGAQAPWEWVWFNFTGAATCALAEALTAAHSHLFTLPSDLPEVQWMEGTTGRQRIGSIPPWEGREQVWRLFTALAEAAGAAGAGHDLVHQARRRIAQRFTEASFSVQVLADDLGVSREHLTRTFRAATGRTPRQSIEDQRLELARRLLHDTHATVAAIAKRCGWNDSEVFSLAFQRWQGLSPARWRAAQGMQPPANPS